MAVFLRTSLELLPRKISRSLRLSCVRSELVQSKKWQYWSYWSMKHCGSSRLSTFWFWGCWRQDLVFIYCSEYLRHYCMKPSTAIMRPNLPKLWWISYLCNHNQPPGAGPKQVASQSSPPPVISLCPFRQMAVKVLLRFIFFSGLHPNFPSLHQAVGPVSALFNPGPPSSINAIRWR